jgi:hypothetical protein
VNLTLRFTGLLSFSRQHSAISFQLTADAVTHVAFAIQTPRFTFFELMADG